VPKDLKPTGPRQTYTATVTYETLELYGTVRAERKFAVEAK